ncbi:alpha/beta hydrolase [Cohnella fermenti]|uniref:Alpha/beta hydrolase n=1 Tax=Cohnella fermenti TaxID=2565925 RepID=A0A4V3WGK5_9BACL|nr:alpha/beta hydrolase-fold protein [Cohnella fermenti]THF84546.1 alpha/beta hydrolase [Cohnella fermenti]
MIRSRKHTAAGRELLVYVPPSYENSAEARYPVVYVHDGGELFHACFNQIEHRFRQGSLPELIVVGVVSPNRNRDYTPWPAESLVPGYPPFLGEGRAYVDELADVVKPFIDASYRTKPEAEQTAAIGGSFGGLISLFAGYWRSDAFGRLGLLSASFWYEGVLDYVREHPPLDEKLKVYMSVGDCEGIYKANAQLNMVPYTRQAYKAWTGKTGSGSERLRFEVTPGGTHDLHCMAQHFPEALEWLFGERPVERKSESPSEHPFTLPGTTTWEMHSRRTGRPYRIFLYAPTSGEAPERGYPVLVSLDANASFATLAEAMRLQGRPPRGFSQGVIVGIGYPSDEPLVTSRRFYDYTTKADPAKLPARPDRSEWPETGGVNEFLAFLEEELLPAVERAFPIDRERRALFGHSLGGWFALHALAERPELFSGYIAGSPSVWWDGSEIQERLPAALEKLDLAQRPISLLIGVGADEKPSMVAEAERLARQLEPLRERGLRLEFRRFEGAGHVSVVPALAGVIFRFLFEHRERI